MFTTYLSLLDGPREKSLVEEIYRNYKNLMFSVSNSILNSPADAEDAVHEAFLRIIKNISKISSADCPKTRAFAVIIVRNIALDMLKKKKHTVSAPAEDFEDVSDLPPAEEEAISELSTELLKDALKRLPKNYFEILTLKIYYGFSEEELGAVLGINSENAGRRLRRARQKLREILKEVGYE